jgi:hypothetical protein
LTHRAFTDWQDGLHFYERCFSRDRSASFKQQGAIFLLRKKQYSLAFSWIDEAKGIAGQRSASVRNTYAVILFNANYDKVESAPDVISTLDESMITLQKCYSDDLRKVYHAKVFSDQAVKYAAKFPTLPASMEYLDLAASWLNTELISRQGDRSINSLLRELKTARRAITHR